MGRAPQYGGDFVVHGTALHVGHQTYLDLQHLVELGEAFMLTRTVDGEAVDHWVDLHDVDFKNFKPDPSIPGELSIDKTFELDASVDDHQRKEWRHMRVIDTEGGVLFGVC